MTETADALPGVDALAAWSPWAPWSAAVPAAPTTPGVYMAREGVTGPVVYVGMAGPRNGNGLRGRLRVYNSGKGAVSGLGEAALDRALADPAWLVDRVSEVQAGTARRAKDWAALAVTRANLHLRWACTPDRAAARALEVAALAALADADLWNRAR